MRISTLILKGGWCLLNFRRYSQMNQKPKFKIGDKVMVPCYNNQICVILGYEKFKTKKDTMYFYTVDVNVKGKIERHYFKESQLCGI